MSLQMVPEVRDFYGGLGFTVIAMFIGSMIYEQIAKKRKSKAQKKGKELPYKTQLEGKSMDDFSEGDVEMVVNPLQRQKHKAAKEQPPARTKKTSKYQQIRVKLAPKLESLSFYVTLDAMKSLLFNGIVFAYVSVYVYILAASFGYSIFRTEVHQYFE
jgi:hypothetical protein